MAPKGSRGKAKGEKRKDDKVLPVAVDITVNLPDESQVVLKGISTDKIMDVKRLLCVNTVTCAITNYSLSHEIRGGKLKDTVHLTALKPCTLTLIEEPYNEEEQAVAHVRRLIDIVACTSYFGPAAPEDAPSSAPSSKKSAAGPTKEIPIDIEAEMSGACPKLGAFYEFFSLANLTPPLQFVRRTSTVKQDVKQSNDHLFSLEVKVCNGKMILVEACAKGFHSMGKQKMLCHDLVDLLRQLSKAFNNAYEELMKAFLDRNKFGNLPYGYRANTWLVPPIAAQSPSSFQCLPTEDVTWGGNGGGWGRDGKSDTIPWSDQFLLLTTMPCKTAEERQVRDRRTFLLHCLFVDVAIFRAISAVRDVMEKYSGESLLPEHDEILHFETVGDLSVSVIKDTLDASCKVDTKIDGSRTTGMDCRHLMERNLLKGITADENTTAHDFTTLGVISVRFHGYIAIVKINNLDKSRLKLPLQTIDIADQPDGGANALNTNSLRTLLHKQSASEKKRTLTHSPSLEQEELSSAQVFVEKLMNNSLAKLEEDKTDKNIFMRWELGACWIQHLQDQKNADKDKINAGDKDTKQNRVKLRSETKVEGLGKPLKIRKNLKQLDVKKSSSSHILETSDEVIDEHRGGSKESENQCLLKNLLSDFAFLKLEESETGLHLKSPQELTEMALKYYDDVALPKLVADFGSLELSPVDGRTLTDFMHIRGLCMCSLGRIVKLSEKLSHVQSLCVHEMIIRAFKHILRAVITSVPDSRNMAVSIAAALNLLLGIPNAKSHKLVSDVYDIVWRWLVTFLKKRYDYELTIKNYSDTRKYAILRGVCHRVQVSQI